MDGCRLPFDAVAGARRRERLSHALQAILRIVSIRPPRSAWTSLEAVARTVVHIGEGRFDPPGPVAPVLELAQWARPLCTSDALALHGRRLDTCLGQRSWWRATARRQGLAFAIEWEGEVATLWVVADRESGAAVHMLTGADNAPVSAALAESVAEALRTSLEANVDPFGLDGPEARPGWVGFTDDDLANARAVILDALSPGSSCLPAVRHALAPGERVPGLPRARWTRFHEAFAHPERFQPCTRGSSAGPEGGGSAGWNARTGGLELRTPHARMTVFPTTPPTVRVEGGFPEPPVLWFSVAPADHADPDIPDRARNAMALFASYLPLRVVDAHRIDGRLGGFLVVWALTSAPALLDLFEEWPVLVGPVLDHLHEEPESLRELRQALEGVAGRMAATVTLAWLGHTRTAAMADRLDRLGEPAAWTGCGLRSLDRLLGEPRAVTLLDSLHRLQTAQLAMVDAAWQAGLLDRVRASLLHGIRLTHAGEWSRSRLHVAFMTLAAARGAGASIPAIRNPHHLARLLIEHRVPPPLTLPPCALPGPWGNPLPDLGSIGRVARELDQDAVRWQAAAWAGQLCCVGHPAGEPAVTWLAPSGRRGAVELLDVLGWYGQPASDAARTAVRAGLREHHRRLNALEPGWGASDAVDVGLPLGVGSITLMGHLPLSQLVDVILMLADE